MGKASRRKHAAEQQRLYFDIKGDARNAEDHTRARAMLDALQHKLVDDALREDGFYFLDGKYVGARRPRMTPGMKTQSYAGHLRRIAQVALVPMRHEATVSPDLNSFVVTFATDGIGVWNMRTGEQLGGLLDISSRYAVSMCGAATSTHSNRCLLIAFATHLKPTVVIFDTEHAQFTRQVEYDEPCDFGIGHQQQITCMDFNKGTESLLVTGSLDSTCIIWDVADSDPPMLTTLIMLPAADSGVARCHFTCDDQEVVSVGLDGAVKMWRVGEDVRTEQLQASAQKWVDTMPLTLSISATFDLLQFDDVWPSFRGNDEWVAHRHRALSTKSDTLRVPLPDQSTSMFNFSSESQTDENIAIEKNKKPSHNCHENKDAGVGPDESLGEIERLRREYEKVETFDFERMLNPAAPFLHAAEKSEYNVATVKFPTLSPCGNGHLIRAFVGRKKNGDFASHTSRVSGAAVSKEADVLVTVSFDKSIVCWSLSEGFVRSITREAHAAPITSCAITSRTTSQPRDLELLVATAAQDNLVKVWRIESDETFNLKCVCSLSGHYDTVTSLCFDSSGVFLVSTSDDTLAHCWRVRPAPPDAPSKPDVTVVGPFAITVQWQIPLANGSALTQYVVHTEQLSSLTDDCSDMKKIQDVDVGVKCTSVVIDHLQPGIQYQLCIAAVNEVGQSLWSEPTHPVETLAFAPAKIDKAVQYRDITATSVRLSWKAPCANGANITSFTIEAIPENRMFTPTATMQVDVAMLTIATSEPERGRVRQPPKALAKAKKISPEKRPVLRPPVYEYVVQGLWPGEVYQFVVAGENRCGVAEFSPFCDYVKMESTAPDAPKQPTLSRIDKRFADVTWVKPRSNGGEILQYIIEWTQEVVVDPDNQLNRQSVTLLTKSILGTNYRIDGLKPGRPLRAWMAATNLVYGKLTASPFSPPSELVQTLSDVPDTPEKPKIECSSSHSLIVAVTPPCNNGASIQSYQITVFCEEQQYGILTKEVVRELVLLSEQFDCSARQDEIPRPIGSPVSLRYTIRNMRAKSFYSATVAASNSLGCSQTSESSVAVSTKPPTVPATISEPPLVADIEPTQAKISWTIPHHDGGAVLASIVLQFNMNAGPFENEIVLFHGRDLVLEHLKPKTMYAFRVAASNAVGRAEFSPACEPFMTPSLVEHTIATYFASRPPIEHAKATVLQRRYRLQKKRKRERRDFVEQLTTILATSWHIL